MQYPHKSSAGFLHIFIFFLYFYKYTYEKATRTHLSSASVRPAHARRKYRSVSVLREPRIDVRDACRRPNNNTRLTLDGTHWFCGGQRLVCTRSCVVGPSSGVVDSS